MEITDVKVFLVGEEKLKAFVSVVLDHCFMVNDIKVIEGRGGLFISMPSRRKKNGDFKDIAHPLNNATRNRFESTILKAYERALGDAPVSSASTAGAETGSGSLGSGEIGAARLEGGPYDAPER